MRIRQEEKIRKFQGGGGTRIDPEDGKGKRSPVEKEKLRSKKGPLKRDQRKAFARGKTLPMKKVQSAKNRQKRVRRDQE